MKVLFINEYLPQEMLGMMWLSRAIKDAGHFPQNTHGERLVELILLEKAKTA